MEGFDDGLFFDRAMVITCVSVSCRCCLALLFEMAMLHSGYGLIFGPLCEQRSQCVPVNRAGQTHDSLLLMISEFLKCSNSF